MMDYAGVKNTAAMIRKEINERMEQQTEEDTFDNGFNRGYLTCLVKFNTLLKECGLL